jgi:hypothetical protein
MMRLNVDIFLALKLRPYSQFLGPAFFFEATSCLAVKPLDTNGKFLKREEA